VGRCAGDHAAAAGGSVVRPLFTSRNRDAARLAATLARIAPTELPVLLEGETGTGKSFVARAIHRRSRPGRPFVVVDCGAIPETLLAAELFGHRAGAFTDATRARQGWLERAGHGTLMLDRLDCMAPTAQVALLRVLDERLFYPVGTVTPRRLAARVVASASAGVAAALRDGTLRADLYHRVAGFHAVLPALRDRHEDIVPTAAATVLALSRRAGERRTLDAEAEELLVAYPWPGNFRELAATLQRAFVQTDGPRIGVAALALAPESWTPLAILAGERELPVHEVSRLYGLFVLARHGGNVSSAARALGVSRRTLIRWRRER
jgi:DNA-binding NtrC family response regulator